MYDKYGREWPTLPLVESCPVCGQPDNCGECTHEPLSDTQVESLGGKLCKRADPDAQMSDVDLTHQLYSYGIGATHHSWSRRLMKIAADRINEFTNKEK